MATKYALSAKEIEQTLLILQQIREVQAAHIMLSDPEIPDSTIDFLRIFDGPENAGNANIKEILETQIKEQPKIDLNLNVGGKKDTKYRGLIAELEQVDKELNNFLTNILNNKGSTDPTKAADRVNLETQILDLRSKIHTLQTMRKENALKESPAVKATVKSVAKEAKSTTKGAVTDVVQGSANVAKRVKGVLTQTSAALSRKSSKTVSPEKTAVQPSAQPGNRNAKVDPEDIKKVHKMLEQGSEIPPGGERRFQPSAQPGNRNAKVDPEDIKKVHEMLKEREPGSETPPPKSKRHRKS